MADVPEDQQRLARGGAGPVRAPASECSLVIRFLKLWIGGHHRWSRCWLGQHRWSMPGGWCERCGQCDTFFGGHERCGRTCRHFST